MHRRFERERSKIVGAYRLLEQMKIGVLTRHRMSCVLTRKSLLSQGDDRSAGGPTKEDYAKWVGRISGCGSKFKERMNPATTETLSAPIICLTNSESQTQQRFFERHISSYGQKIQRACYTFCDCFLLRVRENLLENIEDSLCLQWWLISKRYCGGKPGLIGSFSRKFFAGWKLQVRRIVTWGGLAITVD